MDTALAVSMLLARHRADVAMVVAAKVAEMSPRAAEELLETVSDNADELERIAAKTANGVGEVLDVTV